MNTYFARHTMVIGIDQDTRNKLWSEHLVAIHSPHGIDGELPQREDNNSLNPDDHCLAGKRRLNALLNLARDGGYVCAEYSISDKQIHPACGIVEPNTQIERIHGRWGTRYSNVGRPAILFAVRLTNVKTSIPNFPAASRGTLFQWHSIGTRVANIF